MTAIYDFTVNDFDIHRYKDFCAVVAGSDFKHCNRDIDLKELDLDKITLPNENSVLSVHRVGRFTDKEIVSCEFVVVELETVDTSADYTDLAKVYLTLRNRKASIFVYHSKNEKLWQIAFTSQKDDSTCETISHTAGQGTPTHKILARLDTIPTTVHTDKRTVIADMLIA